MKLTQAEREQLQSAARSRMVRAADVRRAKLILMLEDWGVARHDHAKAGVLRLIDSSLGGRVAFSASGLAGMYARHPGREPKQPPAKLEARVLS